MKPGLAWALGATVLLAAATALWPEADPTAGLLPATRSAAPGAALPARSADARKPVPALPAAAPADLAAATTLPTRAADWPAPSPAALAAWRAPAAAPAAAAPQVPSAPVFPYQWIGQLDDGQGAQALLSSTQRSVAARAGTVIDQHWRLERSAGQPWRVTHLPSGTVLALRGAPGATTP